MSEELQVRQAVRDIEAVYRLIKHSETPPGLDVLKKAFGRAAG